MFDFLKKGSEIQNPRNKSSQPPQDLYSVDRSVIAQPADGIPAPAPAPAPTPAPAAAAPAQPAEHPLSYTGVTHDGHQTIVLYAMKEDEPPVTVEQVLSVWKLAPDKIEVAEISHDVYCYDVINGKITILDGVYPGEGTCKDILEKHDARVAEYQAKATGKKPADASTGPVTAEALKATPFDELYKIFDGMDEKERQRIANAIHKAIRHHAEGKQQTGGGSKKDGKKPAESAPQPKQPKPQPAPATNRSRYAGL